jgi:hypothetical protein
VLRFLVPAHEESRREKFWSGKIPKTIRTIRYELCATIAGGRQLRIQGSSNAQVVFYKWIENNLNS